MPISHFYGAAVFAAASFASATVWHRPSTRRPNGFVAWLQTYGRNGDDKLMIQNDIANEVTKAIGESLGSTH
ncbi:hypothetical protein GCM10010981_29060 [Dyella nitratireducens]|uniref:Uncharacterized protein n=1 Tax=Dyella nitratireducens TaxID=1849580 RepID=A0ABQ1G785_9GAMM|nr:hypothetical protein GCM10010981_29060 [Dyella nitratireducens]GLQ40264.1 hypothetical protein GCM10007902_01130 [Dyella nitratireducens]